MSAKDAERGIATVDLKNSRKLAKNATKSELEKTKLVETESQNLKNEFDEQTRLLVSEKSEEKELQKKISALTREKNHVKKEVNLVDLQWDKGN